MPPQARGPLSCPMPRASTWSNGSVVIWQAFQSVLQSRTNRQSQRPRSAARRLRGVRCKVELGVSGRRNGSGPSATQVCYDDAGEDDGKPSRMEHTQGVGIDTAPAKSYRGSEVSDSCAKQRAATVNERVVPKQDKYGTKAHRHEVGNTGHDRRSCDLGQKARPGNQQERG